MQAAQEPLSHHGAHSRQGAPLGLPPLSVLSPMIQPVLPLLKAHASARRSHTKRVPPMRALTAGTWGSWKRERGTAAVWVGVRVWAAGCNGNKGHCGVQLTSMCDRSWPAFSPTPFMLTLVPLPNDMAAQWDRGEQSGWRKAAAAGGRRRAAAQAEAQQHCAALPWTGSRLANAACTLLLLASD